MFIIRVTEKGNKRILYHRIVYDCMICGTQIRALIKNGMLVGKAYIERECKNCLSEIPDIEHIFKYQGAELRYHRSIG